MRLTPSLICLGLFSAIACWPAAVGAQAVSQVEPAGPKPAAAAPAAKSAAAPAAKSAAAPAAKSDAWRFTYHQGRWWYWQPSNSWVYYQDRRWIAYDARNAASASSARRYESGYRGPSGLSDARHWPHGANGSDPNASIHAGGATLHAARPAGSPPSGEHWPHGANGSDPTASSRAGGAAFHPERNYTTRRYSLSESQQAAEYDYYKWRNN